MDKKIFIVFMAMVLLLAGCSPSTDAEKISSAETGLTEASIATAKSTETPTEAPKPTETPTEAPKPTETPTEAPKPTETPTEASKPTKTPTEASKPTEAPTEEPAKDPVSCDHVYDEENGFTPLGGCTYGVVCTKCGYIAHITHIHAWSEGYCSRCNAECTHYGREYKQTGEDGVEYLVFECNNCGITTYTPV